MKSCANITVAKREHSCRACAESSSTFSCVLAPLRAFSLLELLTVIAIIGILAAITIPNLKSFKPNTMAAATSQMLGDVARARQMAISQRTTVYMVFVPPGFWSDPAFTPLPPAEKEKGERLLDKQMIGYNYVSLRRLGDQPGARNPEYLGEWRTLPEGTLIVAEKFGATNPPVSRGITNNAGEYIRFTGLPRTRDTGVNIPFPSPSGANVNLPYIAFNHLGQLVSERDEFIPLALGSAGFPRDASRKVTTAAISPAETPPNNAVDSYNIVRIDWLTGRARIERQEIQ